MKHLSDFLYKNGIKVDKISSSNSKGYMYINGKDILLNNNAKQLLNKISNIDKNMNEKDIYVIDINTIREGKMYSV